MNAYLAEDLLEMLYKSVFLNLMEVSKDIKLGLQNLSTEPGVYHFYDAKEALLYVGKVKTLNAGCRPIFNRKHDSFKTTLWCAKYTY